MKRFASLAFDWLIYVGLAALIVGLGMIVVCGLINFALWEWRLYVGWKSVRLAIGIGLIWGSFVYVKALKEGDL